MATIVTSLVGEHHLAIDVRYVREIIRRPRITPVPCGPANVAGLINLRGRVLTVFDTARCLGAEGGAAPAQQLVVILRSSDEIPVGLTTASGSDSPMQFEQSGLLVCSIGDISEVDEARYAPPPANLPLGKLPFIPALAESDGKLFGVLSIPALFSWEGLRA